MLDAIGSRSEVVLVAGSLGGFTAPLVCERVLVRELVLVNAMIPVPGEIARDWWAHTGALEAQDEAARAGGYGPFDVATYFLNDVDPEIAAEGEPHQRSEADVAFQSVCDFKAWPAIRIRVLADEDDRFFPVGLQRRVAVTGSASRPTCSRVGTCCHSCSRGSWATICCRQPVATFAKTDAVPHWRVPEQGGRNPVVGEPAAIRNSTHPLLPRGGTCQPRTRRARRDGEPWESRWPRGSTRRELVSARALPVPVESARGVQPGVLEVEEDGFADGERVHLLHHLLHLRRWFLPFPFASRLLGREVHRHSPSVAVVTH